MKNKYPFKETPILYGKAARRFERLMEEAESLTDEQRRANREELRKRYEEACKIIDVQI
ncbi:hypothetical protein [Parabacteroides sp.]|uniref:hypothetical protein n=1 Tax=Parabacteroides sp. TaxID=1869337 RepID=UPI00257CCC4B|nr:hypothetical protein [Parabacteroides sp.]